MLSSRRLAPSFGLEESYRPTITSLVINQTKTVAYMNYLYKVDDGVHYEIINTEQHEDICVRRLLTVT